MKAFNMCNELKKLSKNYSWLKDVDCCSLMCAIFNLEDAYKNYFAKRSSFSAFKNRFNRQTYRTNYIRSSYKGYQYSNIEINLERKKIKLPKLGIIKIRGYRNLNKIDGRVINATVIREKTGKYYVSVVVDEKKNVKEKINPTSIVGIDLGVNDLVVTSSGEKYSNNREIEKREKRLKRLQRKLARQKAGSNNYNKTKTKIAIVHSKIKNARKHNIINIVNKIVEENDIIVSGKLKVKEMSKNHTLAKSILDASFNKICELIKWKAKEKRKYYYQVDTYFPSSKKCSHCKELTSATNNLSIRVWECEKCGNTNDRDINASINIMFEGINLHYQY